MSDDIDDGAVRQGPGGAWRSFRRWRWWAQALAWLFVGPIVLAVLAASKPAEQRARWWALAAVAALVWVGAAIGGSSSSPKTTDDDVRLSDIAERSATAVTTPPTTRPVRTTKRSTTSTTIRPSTTTTVPRTTTTLDARARTALAIGRWYNAGGADSMNAISTTQGDISEAAADLDVVEVAAACRSLRDEVREAQHLPPIPAGDVDAEWQEALRDFNLAATFCIAGAESLDTEMLSQSVDLITEGSAAIGRATTALQAYL